MPNYKVWNLDVWGNDEDGYIVNDRNESGVVFIPLDAEDDEIISALKESGFIESDYSNKNLSVNGEWENLNIDYAENEEPIYQLELITDGEYIPSHLKLWEKAENYMGEYWFNWYIVYAHHRDSDLLVESNWDAIIKEFPESDSVKIINNNHWAVGWVEFLAIHKTDYINLARADDIIARLEDYPLLDEEDYSRREYDRVKEIWDDADLSDRLHYLKYAHPRTAFNFFSIRDNHLPWIDGDLYDYLRSD